VVVGAGGVGK
nr:Chain C, KRAS peptide (VVVGAGGVGK) [Homo sapiens]7OW3_F Chain F, KRAS peptide (VVVGAGGVGK) [Homo sapiens]7OW3_I Chain I, KRAS peptide (VVVGAGGVGK) [Homo sapiens]7OW3_L Chain L, KRAS peptide (VVVGAGGVGK) [Homo sapiens]7OW5_C Chain C, KRAS peptide (VVVGAGGVGK) [Homo sapiens]8DVG_C Chain C, VAL-VAL-VAL-GLY-ALA-GLY-GLY-VAL-GLY-LYS [Homo sapiens]